MFADPLGLAGQHLGPYVVQDVATMGGVAIIYRGEHEALKNAVAVKVLRPELVEDAARPTLEQMFLREAQILSQLRSDDILRALDHGRVVCPGDGVERPYIVVDWLEGRPLSEELEERALERKPYTLTEAIDVLDPIARALGACHESGLVHRDVNPRNVFLVRTGPGRPPRAKLIDFGFAKEVARTEALRLENVDGTLYARSPDYAAPEHYDREKYGELSENTDIYTFALMLVEMLTLAPPLRGTTDEELYRATTDRTDRPTPNRRGASVSPEIEGLFEEALAIDQFGRPGVLADWWDRLGRASRGEAPEPSDTRANGTPATGGDAESGAGATPPEQEERPKGTRKLGRPIAVGVALLALGAGGAVAYVRTRPVTCDAGFSDCNGDRSDGCEADLAKDPANCGACGATCNAGDGTLVCVKGHCEVARCQAASLRDCNGDPGDGCEADLRTDEKNCGDCGSVCSGQGAKQATCKAGKCEIDCKTGFGDCDHGGANGCEAVFASDALNCGRCGVSCGDSACVEGLCAPKELAAQAAPGILAAASSSVFFWNAAEHRIERILASGERSVVVPHVDGVTSLAAGSGRIAWSAELGVHVRPLDGAASRSVRLASSLASDTPLVLAGDFLSWANRAGATMGRSFGKRNRALPPVAQRRIFTVRLESLGEKPKIASIDCGAWPMTFAGDGRGAFCCDDGTPLTAVECAGGTCADRALDTLCPDSLALDGEHAYFGEDVRLLELDRKLGKVRALAKRKRRPRLVTVAGDYVYWAEGDHAADVFRLSTGAAGPGSAPELLARRQPELSALAADDDHAYWIARDKDPSATDGHAVYALAVRRH
jgi:tRNA A-37 threonylcarbamoyl transferase component Bud32